MIIRVLDDKRANACDQLLTKLIQDERQYDNYIDEGFVVKDYYRNAIKDKKNYLLCYEEDNIIKGFIYLKYTENERYIIDALYVEEEYRNNDIASKLIDEVLKILNDLKVEYVDINVIIDNKIAYHLYKSFGFKDFKVVLRKQL